MTSRIRKIPNEIPSSHSFSRFLVHLATDEACDPFPDILERAHAGRYFVGFMGENSNARQTRFIDLLKSGGDTGAQVLTQKFGETSCSAVIWLTRFSPVTSPGDFTRINDENDGSTWLALPNGRHHEPIPKVEDENCTLMPTY